MICLGNLVLLMILLIETHSPKKTIPDISDNKIGLFLFLNIYSKNLQFMLSFFNDNIFILSEYIEFVSLQNISLLSLSIK